MNLNLIVDIHGNLGLWYAVAVGWYGMVVGGWFPKWFVVITGRR